MAYGYVNPATGPGFTIELWFKSDAVSATYRTLFNSRTQAKVTWTVGKYGQQMIIGIAPTTNALQFTIVEESPPQIVQTYTDGSPGGYANDNQWHHLAWRLGSNKQAWTLFLDGEVYASGNTTNPVEWNPSIQTFGGEYAPHMGDNGTNLWNKWLAYCVLYERPLSDNRILEHYTAGAGGTVYYGDDEVVRLHRIADWAEVPDQSREFEDSLVELQGIQVAGTNALSAFDDTAFAAGGLIYADGQSRLVYHNRQHSYNRWNVVTLAESTDSAPEVGLTFTVDDTNIYNDILGDRPFGSQVRIVDATSKASYGRKTYSFSIPVTTHEELTNAVSWISARYREAVVRVSDITFRAESSDLIEWIGTGGITVGDHITLDELPAGSAPEVTMEFIVEKISINVDVRAGIWAVQLELSPFELQRVFQVGVSYLGSIDKIAY